MIRHDYSWDGVRPWPLARNLPPKSTPRRWLRCVALPKRQAEASRPGGLWTQPCPIRRGLQEAGAVRDFLTIADVLAIHGGRRRDTMPTSSRKRQRCGKAYHKAIRSLTATSERRLQPRI